MEGSGLTMCRSRVLFDPGFITSTQGANNRASWDAGQPSLEVEIPGLTDQILAEGMVALFVGQLEAGGLVDATGRA